MSAPAGAYLVRLTGVTAHFRDPRYNTGAPDGLPLRTLRCPPPSTVHGLLCAAAGRWVEPETLRLGWRTEYASVGSDFQTCQLPKRAPSGPRKGTQIEVKASPRVREFLAFPVLTILAVTGVNPDWFRRPVNPLSLGRSEDLIVRAAHELTSITPCEAGRVRGQCLPLGQGHGTVFSAPLFFAEGRRPVATAPLVDAFTEQEVSAPGVAPLYHSAGDRHTYFLWDYNGYAAGKK